MPEQEPPLIPPKTIPDPAAIPAPAALASPSKTLSAAAPLTQVPALRPPATARENVPTAPAPRKRPWLRALGAVVVLAGGGLVWWQPWAAAVPRVSVETVAPAALSRVLAVNGRIATLHPVEVRATVSGVVLEVLKSEGDAIVPGDVIARIEAAASQAAVRQALAALDAGTVAQAQSQTDAARMRALGGNVARNTLEDATRAVQSAAQEVTRLSALFDQAQIQLAKYTIAAPIAGTVLIRGVEPGQTADATTVLFTLADLSAPVVQTEVDEAYAAQIALGQDAVLQMVGETATHPGTVSFVAPRVNPDTGALVVKITPDPALTAPVGLTVTANIVVDKQEAALSVPRAALMAGTDPPFVLMLEGTTARKREIAVIDWPAERLIVTSGLAAGDRVIADPTGLSDGQTVKVAGD